MLYPELDTPCLIVDLDVAERNVRRIQELNDRAGVKLRPHTKTHKSASSPACRWRRGRQASLAPSSARRRSWPMRGSMTF